MKVVRIRYLFALSKHFELHDVFDPEIEIILIIVNSNEVEVVTSGYILQGKSQPVQLMI